MRVLHINTWDFYGGAAQGMFILHKELLRQGIDSLVLVQHQTIQDKSIVRFCDDKDALWRQNIDALPLQVYSNKRVGLISTAILSSPELLEKIEELNPDIVHFHWIGGGMISIEDISKIKKPIIWTLRDFWAFTGGCHHAIECDKYMYECGACTILQSENAEDLTYEIIQRKKKSYSVENITVVGISKWMSKKAKESSVFQSFDVQTIYNNIDTRAFKFLDQKEAKEYLGLKTEKKIISFGAHNLGDTHKGLKLFLSALELLNQEEVFVLLFGSVSLEFLEKVSHEYHSFGYIEDKEVLQKIYAASDVFVAPSLLEPFGKTVGESMACGTPVVAFAGSGGAAELIEHEKDGYLVTNFSVLELADGIRWILRYKLKESAAALCVQKVIQNFSAEVSAKQYVNLYKTKKQMFTETASVENIEYKSLFDDFSKNASMKSLLHSFELLKYPKVVVYGYGFMGEALEKVFSQKIKIFVDLDIKKIDNKRVFHPQVLQTIYFDMVIISAARHEKAIKNYLIKDLGVESHKIISFFTELQGDI